MSIPEIVFFLILITGLAGMRFVLYLAEKEQTEEKQKQTKENNRPRILRPDGHPIRP